MKTILLLIVAMTILSCKKEYCWKCHSTEIWRYSNGTATTNQSDDEVCNKTQKEIDDYQKGGNYVKQDASQGITIVHTMSCTR